MKNTVTYMLLAFAVTTGLFSGQTLASETGKAQTIIRNGEQHTLKGSERFFTGNVRIDPLYPANNDMRSSGGSVTFEPGRSFQLACSPCGAGIDHNFRRGPDPGMGQTRPGSPSG